MARFNNFTRLIGFFLILSLGAERSTAEPVASFPLQFVATVTITAHLVEEESVYPPRVRRMTILYDYIGQVARAEIEAGYEAAKVYIRRYDLDNEYMIRLPPINDCKRSHLGDIMPFPEIPHAQYVKEEILNGVPINYFIHEDFETRIHMYFEKSSGAPVRLIQESTENNVSIPLLTYDYSNVELGQPSATWFNVPEPYSHNSCTLHAGGFPYLHIFHYFVRF